MKMIRTYLSNIRSTWPFERQEALFDAKLPGWRGGSIHKDTLTTSRLKARDTEAMTERNGDMVRATTRRRGSTIYVAALSILARTPSDFLSVVAKLHTRGDTLVSLDSGTCLAPGVTADQMADAVWAFEKSVLRVGDAGKSGGKVSGERRAAKAKAACDAMAPYWALPTKDYPTAELLKKFGVSRPTALIHLKRRAVAQALLNKIEKE